MFVLQHTALLQGIILCLGVLSIIYSTVWDNEFIATMNLIKDNSGDIARTEWHLLSYGYNLQLYG